MHMPLARPVPLAASLVISPQGAEIIQALRKDGAISRAHNACITGWPLAALAEVLCYPLVRRRIALRTSDRKGGEGHK